MPKKQDLDISSAYGLAGIRPLSLKGMTGQRCRAKNISSFTKTKSFSVTLPTPRGQSLGEGLGIS